ncbi:proheparin-binding EGF-like growth factor [Ictalurus furcatus]|uniref:proheparin-binding EGF-like growth factor n=1 Tax=Ictalurus furcatus TaxID=66913 RepID=UPI002350FB37|nr:proheparin-binding EGF-like growth factor [Ictalurus furcatus]
MNLILLSSLLCLACSVLISLASPATHASEMSHMTVMSASGEGLQSALGEEPESEDGPSGLFTGPPLGKGRGGRKKHGGKKRNKAQVSVRQRNSTPAQNLSYSPSHSTSHSSSHSTNHSSAPDPCSTSHREYCIHGYCTYLQDLKEPICVCMKGYDGMRCGIQLLQTGSMGRDDHHDDTLHITLITITVVLSIISCSALLLIIYVHYRAQHSFQAALLSAADEGDKLQNNSAV